MGRKYASIHIYWKDYEKVLTMIENCYFDRKHDLIMESFFNELKEEDPTAYEHMINNPILGLNNILVIKSNKFISIYDEENTFESIVNRVKKLSINIDCPILYLSNFDEDVFLIGVYKSGKLVTSGKMGTELSDYSIKPKNINIDKLCDALQLEKTESLYKINSTDEIDEIERELEINLQISLELDIDSIMSDSAYEQILKKKRIYVFNKK